MFTFLHTLLILLCIVALAQETREIGECLESQHHTLFSLSQLEDNRIGTSVHRKLDEGMEVSNTGKSLCDPPIGIFGPLKCELYSPTLA